MINLLHTQHIPADHHCITVDLPGHGETVGLNEDVYTIDKFVKKLKLVYITFDCFTKECFASHMRSYY
jgi:hypothetical protein